MQSGPYFPEWWIFLFTVKYLSIVTVSNCSNADVMDFSQPANESPHKCTLNSFTLLHRIIGTPGSADILLRLRKQTVHHPHAPAYALTPFSHTHLWPKRIRLSLVQRQSYSLASKEGGGAAVFPAGPKHRAHFMARTAGTHIGLSIFCISPAFGSVRTVRNAVGFGVQTGLNQQDDVFLWVCLSWGWWVSDVLYQWRS